MYGSAMPPQQPGIVGGPASESLQICVPNAAVGAIIGAAGANIKQIMRDSGAFVNVSLMLSSIQSCSDEFQTCLKLVKCFRFCYIRLCSRFADTQKSITT